MREMKFRLRIDNKIVGYEKWYEGCNKAKPCWLYSKDGKYWNPEQIYHNLKDQYIGFKLPQSGELYEGDVVDNGNEKYEIKWNNPTCCWIVRQINGKCTQWNTGDWIYRCRKYLKIIGTIYENPELLEQG